MYAYITILLSTQSALHIITHNMTASNGAIQSAETNHPLSSVLVLPLGGGRPKKGTKEHQREFPDLIY